jgi:hypothetical protein
MLELCKSRAGLFPLKRTQDLQVPHPHANTVYPPPLAPRSMLPILCHRSPPPPLVVITLDRFLHHCPLILSPFLPETNGNEKEVPWSMICSPQLVVAWPLIAPLPLDAPLPLNTPTGCPVTSHCTTLLFALASYNITSCCTAPYLDVPAAASSHPNIPVCISLALTGCCVASCCSFPSHLPACLICATFTVTPLLTLRPLPALSNTRHQSLLASLAVSCITVLWMCVR